MKSNLNQIFYTCMREISVLRFITTVFGLILLFPTNSSGQTQSELKFVDAKTLMLIGNGFEDSVVEYGRLPKSLEENFRKELIDLGANSAGLAIRFSSNSATIAVKWSVKNNFSMNHMAATGVRGLDLYIFDRNDLAWRHAGTAIPSSKKESFSTIINGIYAEYPFREDHEYLLYLPLYDGIDSLEIGVDFDASIDTPQKSLLTKTKKYKPIIFYGTSITQGGCASRPGMAYPSILSRELGRETINLGFSGNGRMDISVANAIKMIDALALVVDCLPNMTSAMVRDSAYNFISTIADANPVMTIYLVENPSFPQMRYNSTFRHETEEENGVWREVFERLRRKGYINVEYISSGGLFSDDNESTVDGTHFTDLGFMRYSQELLPYLEHLRVVK